MQCITIYDAESDSIVSIFHRAGGIATGTGDLIAEIADFDGIDGIATPHVVLANHRGDTVMTLDATSGAISSHIHYDAFGNVKHTSGTFSPTYTFSTKEFLEDVALYLYPYRAYDPISGRWTQRDPIDYQDSINLYQFCGNNPVNGFDVDGRFNWKGFRKGLVKTVGGVAMVATGVAIIVVAGPAITAGAALGATALIVGGAVVGGVGAAETTVNTKSETPKNTPISTPGAMGANLANHTLNKDNNIYLKHTFNGAGFTADSLLTGPAGSIGVISDTLSGCSEIYEASEDYKTDLEKQNTNNSKNE